MVSVVVVVVAVDVAVAVVVVGGGGGGGGGGVVNFLFVRPFNQSYPSSISCTGASRGKSL